MKIIELYNDFVKIECETQEIVEANLLKYSDTKDAQYKNLQQREVEKEIPTETFFILPLNWLQLEQSLKASELFSKGLLSVGNGFPLLLATLANGKRGESDEKSLLTAIEFTLNGLQDGNALTIEEIEVLNNLLLQNNFTIQIYAN